MIECAKTPYDVMCFVFEEGSVCVGGGNFFGENSTKQTKKKEKDRERQHTWNPDFIPLSFLHEEGEKTSQSQKWSHVMFYRRSLQRPE